MDANGQKHPAFYVDGQWYPVKDGVWDDVKDRLKRAISDRKVEDFDLDKPAKNGEAKVVIVDGSQGRMIFFGVIGQGDDE